MCLTKVILLNRMVETMAVMTPNFNYIWDYYITEMKPSPLLVL